MPAFYIIQEFQSNYTNHSDFGLPSELMALTTVLSSVEHLLMLLVNHESLTSLFTFVANEIAAMKLLLEVQLTLIRCEVLCFVVS